MNSRRRLCLALVLVLAVGGVTLTACNGATDQVAANALQPTPSNTASAGAKAATTKRSTAKTSTTRSTTTTKPAAPGGAGIDILNFQFLNLTAKAGQVTKVLNKDTAPHTLTADTRAFDTGIIGPGTSGTFTAPTTPGTYKIHCDVHPYMTGTLQVS